MKIKEKKILFYPTDKLIVEAVNPPTKRSCRTCLFDSTEGCLMTIEIINVLGTYCSDNDKIYKKLKK